MPSRSLLAISLAMLVGAPSAQDPIPAAPPHPFSTTALAAGLEYADPLTVRAPKDFLRGHAATAEKGLFHAVVEIPTGACDKWEVKADGVMRWDIKDDKPRHVKYLGYPANYGIVPRTLLGKELGGDGDPLDVLVLGPSLPRGTVLAVKVLGTIRLVDAGDKDDKLVAVPPDSAFAACTTVEELDAKFPGVTTILRTWFQNYKGPEALQCSGFGSAADAHALLVATMRSFEAAEAAARKAAEAPKAPR